ncbi:pilus assembly protein CpaF [Microbacterium sp. SZ1]|uniref:TadA family conjugal transfer-associated ATPase n=1 Tax=Microbacterium sp. SZ1 TaxID=1849736 RepID=UPI000BBC3C40|nr:TadA family conjugal transfer-associated ATPase [Microbacterium sp. SZ1]PCE14787.1 pilus assembly protein CpaF [Microbacterium sp. SZ1]
MSHRFVIEPRDAVTHPGVGEASTRAPLDPAFGPLAEFCADGDVTDVFVNGSLGLFVDRGRGTEAVQGWRASEREVRDLAVALVGLGGRHLDDQAPCVDVRLASGIRVHAVLAPVSASGTALSVRVPRAGVADLDALAALGSIDDRQKRWLLGLVRDRTNVLISGGTGTGKTTLLSALLTAASENERIVTIEDVAELSPRHPHHVALEARQPNLEGAGGISLARLVRESLRMRPDRLIVGECRGEEVRELLSALNTGHDGGAGTLHASGLGDVPARLEALGALAGLDATALARQAVSAFGIVLHLHRDPDGMRRIERAGTLTLEGDRLGIEEVQPW